MEQDSQEITTEIYYLMILRPPRSTQVVSSAASDVYKRQDPNIIRIETDLEIIDFIWKGLNQYYYWQESVVNLSDSKKESESDYAYFLSQNPDPENFFNSLLHPDDNFSWIVDD